MTDDKVEMVERVALGILVAAQAVANRPYNSAYVAEADGGRYILDGSFDLQAFARAAIEAMRELTEAMTLATREEQEYGDYGGRERHEFCEEWRRAIDAALTAPRA